MENLGLISFNLKKKVYQRKVDDTSSVKARLYQLVAAKEAELADLMASLGEHNFSSQKFNISSQPEKRLLSLKEQLASITPLLEDLKARKEKRVKKFADILSQIEKITSEITENGQASTVSYEEQDLSMRKLDEYQTQLRLLQKEKEFNIEKLHLVEAEKRQVEVRKIIMENTIQHYMMHAEDLSSNSRAIEENIQQWKQDAEIIPAKIEFLEASKGKLIGKNLEFCSMEELNKLEGHLVRGLGNIRGRKNHLLAEHAEQLKETARALHEENALLQKNLMERSF